MELPLSTDQISYAKKLLVRKLQNTCDFLRCDSTLVWPQWLCACLNLCVRMCVCVCARVCVCVCVFWSLSMVRLCECVCVCLGGPDREERGERERERAAQIFPPHCHIVCACVCVSLSLSLSLCDRQDYAANLPPPPGEGWWRGGGEEGVWAGERERDTMAPRITGLSLWWMRHLSWRFTPLWAPLIVIRLLFWKIKYWQRYNRGQKSLSLWNII